ncbi:MAG: hypothetical protein ACPHID_01040 [Thermoplasmatota archaeon]
MFDPLLLVEWTAPTPVIIAIVLIVVALLVLRFIIKTAITLVKIGILVAIGVATYVGLSYVLT